MGTTEKEYSVPHELVVCHDEDRIHGVRLSLTMHRWPFEGEEELLTSDYGQGADIIEHLDDMIE